MLAIRGVYNGKTFTALPSETLPEVEHEVLVAIVFLEDVEYKAKERQTQIDIARRMQSSRDAMPPLGTSIKELIEDGRER